MPNNVLQALMVLVMKTGAVNLRASEIQSVMTRIKVTGVEVVFYEQLLMRMRFIIHGDLFNND